MKSNNVATGRDQVASASATAPAETKSVPATETETETATATEEAPVSEESVPETKSEEPETKSEEPASEEPPKAAVVSPGFIVDLQAILATSKSRSSGGAKIRANVGYTLVPSAMKSLTNQSVPEQEQVILRILNAALTTEKPVISEPELNKLVLAAFSTGVLKTKQDAWHIFRYYRTDLKKRGVLREITYESALAA